MTDFDLDQLEKLCARARNPARIEDGEPFLYLPEGTTLESAEQFLPAPLRVKRSVQVTTVEAFNRYFNEFKPGPGSSRIFADLETVAVVGIFDDHEVMASEVAGEPAEVQPMWASHRVAYRCPYSRQWEAWTSQDRRRLGQVEFAEWLEDRVADVAEPEGADLLDMCLNLSIHRKAAFSSSARLESGEFSISYSEENDSGTIEIPAMLTLAIPVFQDGQHYKVPARFRHRLADGKLQLWFELVEPQRFVEDAFKEVVRVVELGREASDELEAIEGTGTKPFSAKIPT